MNKPNKPKWTPGPLWVDPEEPEDIMSEGGELVATAYPMDGKPGEAEANAVLYAAASDLYEALAALKNMTTDVIGAYTDTRGTTEEPGWLEDLIEGSRAARAALAKARGEAARVESESDMERDRR